MVQNEPLHALQVTIEESYDIGSYLKPGHLVSVFSVCIYTHRGPRKLSVLCAPPTLPSTSSSSS